MTVIPHFRTIMEYVDEDKKNQQRNRWRLKDGGWSKYHSRLLEETSNTAMIAFLNYLNNFPSPFVFGQ